MRGGDQIVQDFIDHSWGFRFYDIYAVMGDFLVEE